MDNCEIELNGDPKTKTESDKDSSKKLEKHLGKLLVLLQFAGIPVNGDRKGSKILDLLQKWCYPIFILLSGIFLLYSNLDNSKFAYWTVIDTFQPVLTCVMWIMLRCQTDSLKCFFADLSCIASKNFKSQNRRLAYLTNAGIGFIFVYPLLLLAMRVVQDNTINEFEIFRILQEGVFPLAIFVVYTSVCGLLLQKIRFCSKMFQKLDLSCPTASNMIKDYLSVSKSVEHFEKLMSNLMFVVLFHDFLIISIIVMDMFYMKNWVENLMIEALCELAYVFVSLLVMSVCAGNVTSEMSNIKSVVLDKALTQLDQTDSTNNEKHVNLLLKKDPCVLTVGKAIVFNRGFMLKVLLAVFTEVVLVCELFPFLKS